MELLDKLPNPSPGDTIREDFLNETGMTLQELAKALNIPVSYLEKILDGHKPITENLAGRLEKVLGCSAQFWLNLQEAHDREKTK